MNTDSPALAAVDGWDEEACLRYLEAGGGPASEYDLEADGLARLREDCRALLRDEQQAA